MSRFNRSKSNDNSRDSYEEINASLIEQLPSSGELYKSEMGTPYQPGPGSPPVLLNVIALNANGPYIAGDVITIHVIFDEEMILTLNPPDTFRLELNTGGGPAFADYTGSIQTTFNNDTLVFSYTVQAGDNIADLEYVSNAALVLGNANGSTLVDADNTNPANLTLANPGAAGSLGANSDIELDTTVPTVGISLSDSALLVGDTATVTFTFNEAVTGFDNTDITGIPNGSLSAVSSGDGGITWTATYTPNASLQDATNLITVDMTGLTDFAGNAGSGNTDSGNFAIDTLRPTATIVVADNSLLVGETSLVTITFNEAVTNFSNADLTIANGTLSVVSTGDGGITWTATLTPTTSVSDTTNLITLDNTTLNDLAGNAGTGTTDSNNYAIDTVRPTATIVVADSSLLAGETSLVTITFNEAVTNFSNADLTIANGTLSVVSSGDGGITWTATLTPTTSVSDTTNLITLDNTTLEDLAGNAGTGTTDSNNYAIDTVRPTATIVVADSSLLAGETSLVTITFNEAVTNFSNADLTIANGTLSVVSTGDGGITWTATLTPTTSVSDTTNLITLDNTTLNDLAGNAGTGTTNSNNYAVETVRPTVSVTVGDTALQIGDTPTVTFTFSEAVTGFTNADLTIANGTLSPVGSSDGGITWTATLTPTLSIEDTSNLITVTNTGYANAVGNTGTGSTNSNNYAVDTLRPTATIVVADNALKVGETSLLTITFSEAVTGFDNSDLTIANGSLTAVGSSDGGITWTATLTPTASIEDTTNLISLNNTGVADAAGNTGSGTTDSNNYAIDTLRPTVAITVDDTALAIGQTATVTFTFSEAVTGLDTSDVTVANGSLSAISTADGGITWTATLTPNASVTDATNVMTLDNTAVTDLAGNAGSGTTDSQNYAIDSTRPTATIVVADTSLIVGETSLVTITFSEAVTSFDNTDLTIANGSLSAVSSGDGGVTWTATLTPTNTITDTTNLISLNNTTITDLAGNAGTGSTDSNNYAIDTVRPVLATAVTLSDSALKIGDTSTVTMTFSEAISNFTTADITSPNGVLSALVSGDGGVTWTATLTPDASISDASNVLTIDYTGLTDLAGNAGAGSATSANYAVDTVRPTLASAITISDTALRVGDTATVTFTFTEAVTSFTTADVLVENGSLSALSSADAGITWTATLTPSASTTDTSNILTLDYTGITDLAGNAGTGTELSGNYAIDTVRPTVSSNMSFADSALVIGDTSLMTIVFSEAVMGLTTGDFTVANGALSALSSSDGGITWTATLTPNASVSDTTNTISLDNTSYTDLNGNTGTGTTVSPNYTIDTLRPTATITLSDYNLGVIDTALVTFTFTEAVTGFTNADLTLPVTAPMGSLSPVSSSDGGLTWTATFTPPFGVSDASNLISLDTSGVADVAGNAGLGMIDSPNFAINTVNTAPTIGGTNAGQTTTDLMRLSPFQTISITDPDINALETAIISLDDPLKGSFTANSMALSGFYTNDAGITYLHDAATPAELQAAIRALVFEPNPARLPINASDTTTITITVEDEFGDSNTDSNTTVMITGFNSGPSDILLSDANVAQSEGPNATVGLLSAIDKNVGDTHSFTLSAANAFNDNTKFAIVGNSLKVINPALMTERNYFVMVQATDANGLSFSKKLTVSLDDDIAPYITSIETLRSPRPTITTGSYIVKFNENVTGVSLDDFFLTSGSGATAHLSSITALNGNAYRVYIDQIVGTGSLTLNLKTSGTGIADLFGNSLPAIPPAPEASLLPSSDEIAINFVATNDLLIGVQQHSSGFLL
ncbi:glycosyl hydrolase [Undibacterium seohonense]|uniref:Glycosyl hydrolase n=1 Tax=Undibacterium seohonense TaxID=1344950 RepID=A0ABR6X4A7_9BURK|nr:Ig-like domain-containing protein [Undibacterium seohonense]MBC3807179.1 glycosyl hydrolase [Undibacterium seohonense]